MPTGVYVRTNDVQARLRAGLAADHVDDFSDWLRQRRYTDKTNVERIRLLACWTHWAREAGYTIDTIRAAHAASAALIDAGYHPRFRGDVNKDAVETGKLFIFYLEDLGQLPRIPQPPVAPLVAEYMAWAREQHGLAETTLGTYTGAIIPFVAALGDNPAAYDAAAIRGYMLGRAGTVSVSRLNGIGVAIRAFLRFLIATDRCPAGRDRAMRLSPIAWQGASRRALATQPGSWRRAHCLYQTRTACTGGAFNISYRICAAQADRPHHDQMHGSPRPHARGGEERVQGGAYAASLGRDVDASTWRQPCRRGRGAAPPLTRDDRALRQG